MTILLIFQASLFELASLYLLTLTVMTWPLWCLYFVLHSIACCVFTLLSWSSLPIDYKKQAVLAPGFIFTLNFALPLFGILGTAFSLLVALYRPKLKPLSTWQETKVQGLPLNPEDLSDSTRFGAGGLRDILVHNSDPERRLIAVTAIRHLAKQQSIPLLQLALKDLSDDVRLMAYAQLERYEARINESIHLLKAQFNFNPQAKKATEIAQQYWELCYLGIAEGALKKHYLKEAESYLRDAQGLNAGADNDLLLGRVMLAQGRHIEASQPLVRAQQAGFLPKQVAPYLAEAAFLRRDYQEVKKQLRTLSTEEGAQLEHVKAYWQSDCA